MANNYTSIKLSFDSAVRFLEGLTSDEQPAKYVFIGNSNQYANSDTTIPDIYDSLQDEKRIWDNIFAAKKVTNNDVELVVPRLNWSNGKRYKEFDDVTPLANLVSSSQNVEPMYVVTSNLGVYICLSNNNSSNSTVEPSGDYSSANGFIYSSVDGYTWKYLYTIYESNKFLLKDWIPVPKLYTELEYGMDESNLVEGSVSKIVVTNPGTGYYDRNLVALSYATGTTSIALEDDPTGNIVPNMSVSGNGIPSGTYITDINYPSRIVNLSLPTSNSGNGLLSFSTRVYIEGDGDLDYTATANIVNSNIQSITVSTQGTGYTIANVFIYGIGTGATARVVKPPKYGFGFSPARDLVARNVLVVKKFGEIDSTEGGIISIDTSFRQYGLLSAPHKYGEKISLTSNTANSVMSQTTDLSLVAGAKYTLNEMVYQGVSNTNYYFAGLVHAQTDSVVRLTNVRGTVIIGAQLKGDISGTSRSLVTINYPDFEPYTGDILFVQNSPKTERFDGQAENIKFVIKF